MTIVALALYSSKSRDSDFQNFIVETLISGLPVPNTKLFLLSNSTPKIQNFSNFESIIVDVPPENTILKKIWWDIKMTKRVKQLKADFFISIGDPNLLSIDIPQCLILNESAKPKQPSLKKARSVIVMSKAFKEQLIEGFKLPEERISVVYPFPGDSYESSDFETKENTKRQYTNSNEFFLCSNTDIKKEDFINLLKSFSQFKKRQKSNFQLVVTSKSNAFFQKSLEGYKYRNDVKLIHLKDERELPLITAAAYAVILPFNTNNDLLIALNVMKSGVPIITTKDSVINEVAGDAAVYTEVNTIKDIGEKMMQLYTNENYRSILIEKGLKAVTIFNKKNSAEGLWRVVMKAVQ